jgi:ketosteroid isomerase-like protein
LKSAAIAGADNDRVGRHLEERLALLAPGAARLLFKRIFALPPGHPVRRRVVKRGAVRGWDAVARGDLDAAVIVVEPDYELNLIGHDLLALGFPDRYEGHEGMRTFVERWRQAWSSNEYSVEQVYDLGDRVVVRFTATNRGRTSDLEVRQTAGSVHYLGEGSIVRQDFYWEWEECAAALGLPR